MFPAGLPCPVAGSYTSAELSVRKEPCPFIPRPPATSTFPPGSSAEVWNCRAVARLPVKLHFPVVGSYSSALAVRTPGETYPLPTNTLPFGRSWAI